MKQTSRIRQWLYCGTALGFCAAPFSAHALPVGGVVSGGSAEIRDAGAHTVVHQGTDRAVIDWQSFDVHSGEQVYFSQPSANAAVLNRIHDTDASRIDGALTANGQVYLVNPNGMVFGKGAQVDAAGLVATTADIGNAAFMQGGRLEFNRPGNPNAAIVNEGSITVKEGGLAALVAPNVSNSGIITAKAGTVALAGGDTLTVDMYGDGLLNVAVSDAVKRQGVTNSGELRAGSGTVLMTTAAAAAVIDSVINMEGVADASSATEEGGEIVFAGQDAEITVQAGAILNATGAMDGGTVHIGGEYQGKGTTPTAKNTTVAKGATINASATKNGSGGEVIVWSDETTRFAGDIKATGGKEGGNGGFVETSGKDKLYSSGSVDASAPKGKAGEWLLDPTNVTISNGVGTDVSAGGTFNGVAAIDANTIQTALNGGTSVTITTTSGGVDTGNITANGVTINKTAGGDATLTLKADRDIYLTNSTITSTLGTLGFTLHADSDNNDVGSIDIQNSTVTTNGGDFTAGGGLDPLTDFAWGNGGNVVGVTVNNSAINTGSGSLNIRGHGENSVGAFRYGTLVSGGSTLTTSSGVLTVLGTGGNGSSDNYGVSVIDGGTQVKSTSGDITITGVGGNGTGSSNRGINVWNSSLIQTDTGAITLTGTSGASATSFNGGVVVWTGSSVKSTGTGGSVGTITLNGSALGTGSINFGTIVESNASVTSVDGNIVMTGAAVASANNKQFGVLVDGGGNTIQSTGNGNITITGTGGAGTQDNVGVQVQDAGSLISVANGNLSITGTGGNGSSHNNHGIAVLSGATLRSTGATPGNITLNGTAGGSSAGGTDSYGVYINGSGKVTGAGGTMTITGREGSSTGNSNYGVSVNGATAAISNAGTGSLTVTGTGGGTGASGTNLGVHLDTGGATIKTTGTGALSVTGNAGGNGGTGGNNRGVYVGQGTSIQGGGVVTISGTGGTGSGSFNDGVFVNQNNAHITATGAGAMSVTGQGGGTGASAFNVGVTVYQGNAAIQQTGTGSLTVMGTGGNNSGAGGGNYGVFVDGGTSIKTTGGGALTVTGTAGNNGGSGTDNFGIRADGAFTGSGGAMSVTGTGGRSTGNSNHGVYLNTGIAVISNTGAGSLTVSGTGGGAGASDNNQGVYVQNVGAAIKTTGTGDLTVTGVQGTGGASRGIRNAIANGIQTAGTGNLTAYFDSYILGVANAINSGGALTIAPATANTSLGVGTGAGALQLTDAELGNLSWGAGKTLTLGSSTTGAIDINSGFNFATPVVFQSGAGHDITLNGALTSTYNTTDIAVTLASGGNFINNAGAAAITTVGAARWMIYSVSPALDTLNGLVSDFSQFGCVYGSCALLAPNTTTGKGFLYSSSPLGTGSVPPTPVETIPAPTPAPVPVSATPEPVPVTPVSATPGSGSGTEEIPVPQFLMNALLPTTYVVPVATGDRMGSASARSYDSGAPTPGLDASATGNIDVIHAESQRSGYDTASEDAFGTYVISPELHNLLNP